MLVAASRLQPERPPVSSLINIGKGSFPAAFGVTREDYRRTTDDILELRTRVNVKSGERERCGEEKRKERGKREERKKERTCVYTFAYVCAYVCVAHAARYRCGVVQTGRCKTAVRFIKAMNGAGDGRTS